MFENLGLQSFAKTSGSKGLQVYIPLNSPDVTFEQTKPFARAVAELLEQAEPELVVSRMTKTRRTGKVLIDWSQNDRNKTTVCVYSLRAVERPTASTPVDWDEVRATRRRSPLRPGKCSSVSSHEATSSRPSSHSCNSSRRYDRRAPASARGT